MAHGPELQCTTMTITGDYFLSKAFTIKTVNCIANLLDISEKEQ